MSTTIDNKVVEMRFDNKHFESNVSTTLSSLEKLKQSLNLSGATKGLEGVQAAAKNVDMSGLGNAVETVRTRFSALQVMAVTTLANITNSAVNTGKRMISALTIDPIKTGFQEYETQMGAIQTILANTKHEGTNLKDVNGALDELNTYADKTIYNFTEMTRNIGTFTAAGVKLDTSVSSIKGIANLAAISGSTSQQASTAMYQLSQALAAGRVSLMDWNSVVNAGMGGKVFQDALKRTAENQGKNVDEMIKKYGSFRESLTKGEWLTAEVLTETLTQLSGAYSEADLIAQGYTKKQAKEILELANTAVDAATEVKTATQLFDTLKESAQSGWAQTWRILVGDFEEAKKLLTGISESVGGMIGKMSEARNNLLQGWKDMGGRQVLIDGLYNVFQGLLSILKPIGEAFREVFPPMTAKQLLKFTEGFKKLTESFKISDGAADKLKRTFKGIFSIFDIFGKVLSAVAKGIGSLFTSGGVSGVLELILSVTAAIGDIFTAINNGFSGKGLSGMFTGISEVISGLVHGLTGFGDAVSGIGKVVSDVVGGIVDAFKTAFTWITDNVSMGDVFAGLAGGGIFMAGKKLSGLFENLSGLMDKGLLGLIFGGGDKDNDVVKFRDVLGSVKETLGAFTSGIKIGSLVAIAGAIAILSGALKNISTLNVTDIMKSLTAIGIMFAMLTTSFKSITKSLDLFGGKGTIKAGIALMMMAKAIDILADAMKEMSGLSFGEIVKGLVGIGGGMAALALGLKAINGVKIKVTTILAIGALASALKTIGETLIDLSAMSWGEIGRGITAMAGSLAVFIGAIKILEKAGGFKSLVGSVSLVIAAKSLGDIADALSELGGLTWDEIGRGLTAMGGALTELSVITGLLGKLAGFSGLLGAMTIATAANALGDIASALGEMGMLSWREIGRGLTAMGGALTELAVITGLLGKLAGVSGLVGAVALVVTVQALGDIADAFQKFVGLTWDEIKMGLVGMGGALAEVGIITGLLGKLAGFSGLLGAGSILIVVQSLGDIADALKKFGSMTWDEIKRGLTGMGLALTEVAVITGTLGALAGLSSLVGAGSILLAVQGLGDIADALKKFGEMSWDEIGRGLTAMGAALGEIALGGVLNTFSIIGSMSISKVAEPLGILADSVKKWSGVKVPEHLGFQLMALADGVTAFTFGGFGASAIAEVAAPLGVMAGSVKKWADVIVPENLGSQLESLAKGVKKFTFGGMGASAISEVAAPLGTLAGSVKKWTGVAIPDTLGTQLESLADGVKSFSWAFMGAWSIDTLAGPLGTLASSVKKWNGVTIPENLGDQLDKLASGVKSFSWAFMGSWSISSLAGPLGKLASSVKKWSGVKVPKGLGGQLKSLANAVKSFSGISDINSATKGLSSIAGSITKLSNVKIKTIASGLNSFSDSLTKLGSASGSISGLGSALTSNIVKPLNNLGPKVKGAGTKIVSSLASGIKSSSAVKTAANNIVNTASKSVDSKSSNFKNAGVKLVSSLAKGIESKKSSVKNASISGVKSGLTAVKGYRDDFRSAGASIAQGLANGMNSMKREIANAADEMARSAEKATKARLQINSPSKRFIPIGAGIPEGLIVGMTSLGGAIKRAAISMGNGAVDNTKKAISRIADVVGSDVDTQPTIRPVLDLSDVRSGAGAINGMFGMTPSIDVLSNIGAVSSMMNSRIQNGGNGDVISAINKLGKTLGNIGGNTYNVNGVTYDDGTNVSNAVQELVRAARVGRRA